MTETTGEWVPAVGDVVASYGNREGDVRRATVLRVMKSRVVVRHETHGRTVEDDHRRPGLRSGPARGYYEYARVLYPLDHPTVVEADRRAAAAKALRAAELAFAAWAADPSEETTGLLTDAVEARNRHGRA